MVANNKSDRTAILNAIRQHEVSDVELPDLNADWIEYDSPLEQFVQSLESVGGRVVRLESLDQLGQELEKLDSFATAKVRCSLVAGQGSPTFELNQVDDPHDLEDIDFALLSAELGVAENGAVWMTDDGVRHRAVFFIAQHLGVLLSASQIVSNLHQAYQRLESSTAFGLFMSGPSKTADIEQSLVIGAHGARSLTLFLLP
ncbi:MAG: LUD domain-containing protein [Planctomycetales bacterium]|nr:LUD domain-containing protein [Planctomycetales bacterium]